MVNEQIGAENMKRRVEVEHKRQRRLGTLQQKMWKDFTYCQKNGYDWEPRRAQFESQLNDIQAQEHIHVRDDDSDMAMPDEFAGING